MAEALKILAFVGSPRNEESWTWKIMTRLEAAMQERHPTRFEYVFLQKVNVPYCDGCLSCVNVGESACPEYATIGPLAAKMKAANGIVCRVRGSGTAGSFVSESDGLGLYVENDTTGTER